MEEKLQQINKVLRTIASGWDVKEFQIQVNEAELFISLKAVKPPTKPV